MAFISNAIVKVRGYCFDKVRHWHPTIGSDVVEQVQFRLAENFDSNNSFADEIVGWMEEMREDKGKMWGSLCLVGEKDIGQRECASIVVNAIYTGQAIITEIDMAKFYRESGVIHFMHYLFNAMNEDCHALVFVNITKCCPLMSSLLNTILKTRKVYLCDLPDWFAKKYKDHYKRAPLVVVNFSGMLLIGVHYTNYEKSRTVLELISEVQTFTAKGIIGAAYDACVPFLGLPPTRNGTQHMANSHAGLERPAAVKRSHDGGDSSVSNKVTKTNTDSCNTNITSGSHNPDSENNNHNKMESAVQGDLSTVQHNNTTTQSQPPVVLQEGTTSTSSTSIPVPPTKEPRFEPHDDTFIVPFVDAKGYFKFLDETFQSGDCHEILIAGWQLDDVVLQRPYRFHKSLFNILLSAADRGCQIYIMLRECSRVFVPNKHADLFLRLKHTNIRVDAQTRSISNYLPSLYSHHQKFVIINRSVAFVGGIDLAYNRWDTCQHKVVDPSSEMFPDPDYYNSEHKDINRSIFPRMGWHDVHVGLEGTIVHDFVVAFAERWNPNNLVKIPRRLSTVQTPNKLLQSPTKCQATLLRSINGGSIGQNKNYKEIAIFNAYLQLIETAEHYIYIENQYLIEPMKNYRFCDALCNRIQKAAQTRSQFSVVVILPFLPDNGTVDSSVAQSIMQKQRNTIAYIHKTLREKNITPDAYINFYALLKHGSFADKRVAAAQIYVHSKVMITESMAVVGSANINHRSLSGDWDTEIAVLVKSHRFSLELTAKLLGEHSGREIRRDQLPSFMWAELPAIAARNRECFQQAFGLFNCPSVAEYMKVQKEVEGWEDKLGAVQGHIVSCNVHFLANSVNAGRLSWLNPFHKLTR